MMESIFSVYVANVSACFSAVICNHTFINVVLQYHSITAKSSIMLMLIKIIASRSMWVRGHSASDGNERTDAQTEQAITEEYTDLSRSASSRNISKDGRKKE